MLWRYPSGSPSADEEPAISKEKLMGPRPFTVRTLLVWMVLFALLCGILSVSAPLPVFAALFTWIAVVWCATLFCSSGVALSVSIGIAGLLGVAILAPRCKGQEAPDRCG